MSSICSPSATLRRVARLGSLAAAFAVVAPAAWAQKRPAARPTVLQSADPATPSLDLRKRRGFSLYGNADVAGAGMKMNGTFGWGLSNYGPCADGFTIFQCGDVFQDGVYNFTLFELVFSAGAGFSDFRKIRSVYPGVNSMRPPTGYTSIISALLVDGTDWGPADGSIGRLFSGSAVSTSDNSCQDNTSPLNGYMSVGVTLLASSDCPQTWAASGFDGPRPIPDSAFIRQFNTDPNAFAFDFFRIPQEERNNTRFLGDYSTYGETSDHAAEVLAAYGGVTPQGTGAPNVGGFPLGLDIRFEAFRFNLPSLANAVFYNMIVVNNSAAVYGTGIDYDSLYMGMNPGPFGGDLQNNQVPSFYPIPSKGAVLSVPNGVNAGCNGAVAYPGTPPQACYNARFYGGAIGFVALKSPIGDLRNKLLSRPGVFFNPTSPHADDTITFNHMHACGYGATCYNSTYQATDRRGFGMISSTEENVLDGRDPGSLTPATTWTTFRNKNFRGASGSATARFNRFVPGATTQPSNGDEEHNPNPGQPYGQWDYNNDGIQDTIFADQCADRGCVRTWSDTMPGKQTNAVGNVGATMTAGPFPLRAGDTTSFVWAFIGAPDSTAMENLLNDVVQSYMTFYLTPEPPPSPTVRSVEVRPSQVAFADTGIANPVVTIVIGDEPEGFQDQFLLQYASNVESSTQPAFVALRDLNPGLADRIRAAAASNLARVYVFKSCNAGQTFTIDTTCAGAPTVGPTGAQIGVGFQPWRTLTPDPETGQLPNTITDDEVTGGRRYLYSFVAQSRGFSEPVRDLDPVTGDTITRVLVVADTVLGALQRSGPTVANVYVPISLPAGGRAAGATVRTVAGDATIPVTVNAGQNAVSGTYQMIFANRFRVVIETNLATQAVTSTVTALDVIPSAVVGGTAVTDYVQDSTIISGEGRVQFSGDPFAPTTVDTTFDNGTPTTVTERGEIDLVAAGTVGYVLTDGTRPLYVSTDLNAPTSFFSSPTFPGFIVNVDQDVTGGAQTRERLIRSREGQTTGDSVAQVILDANAMQFQEDASQVLGTGQYDFVFQQDAFSAPPFFTVDTVGGVEPIVQQALTSRAVAATGASDDNVARILRETLGEDFEQYADPQLIAAKFPFTVTTANGPAILAMVAEGHQSSILLGAGADTVRVAVPEDVWVPGDEFVVLEPIQRDSVDAAGAVVIGDDNQPIQVADTIVAIGPAVLGCNTPRVSCNPIRLQTRGATGYLPYEPGWRLVLDFARPFTVASEVDLDVTGATAATAQLTKADLSRIRVVPNPYIAQSSFDVINAVGNPAVRVADPRIMFTGVPAQGTLRIYSVSGQFLQELKWTESDLQQTNGAAGTGDLPYNLRTREGLDLSSGLYIYVIKATGTNGGNQVARGKFVVIR